MGNETLTDYILVSQDKFFVEHFQRQTDNSWTYKSYSEREDVLKIETVDCELSLREIYDRVEISIQQEMEEGKEK